MMKLADLSNQAEPERPKSAYQLPAKGILSAHCKKEQHGQCSMLKCSCECHEENA